MLGRLMTLISILEMNGRRGPKAEKPKRFKTYKKISTNMLDPSWVGTKVKYVIYYDMDEEGNKKELRMVGEKYYIRGKRTQCYKKNETINVFWDAVDEAYCSQCKSIEEFCPKKFNKYCEGGRRKEVQVNYEM